MIAGLGLRVLMVMDMVHSVPAIKNLELNAWSTLIDLPSTLLTKINGLKTKRITLVTIDSAAIQCTFMTARTKTT